MITLTSEHVVSGETYDIPANAVCAVKHVGEQKVLILSDGGQIVLTGAGYAHLIEQLGA